jgi:hypothetical protein
VLKLKDDHAFRRRWYFFIALVSITFIGSLSLHLFIPAMSAVKEGFGVSTRMAQLTMTLFEPGAFALCRSLTVLGRALEEDHLDHAISPD